MTRLLTIALILSAMVGMAQIRPQTMPCDTHRWFTLEADIWDSYQSDTVFQHEPPSASVDLVTDWLLPLLNEYETECWNDSTLVTPDPFYVDAHTMRPEPSYYYHTAPTFSGFIKWLKKWK